MLDFDSSEIHSSFEPWNKEQIGSESTNNIFSVKKVVKTKKITDPGDNEVNYNIKKQKNKQSKDLASNRRP